MASSDEEDDELSVPASSPSGFAALSLEDDDSSDESSRAPPSPKVAPARSSSSRKGKKKKREVKQEVEFDDDALLEAAIEEASGAARATKSCFEGEEFLRFDARKVDAEREVSSRLGAPSHRNRRQNHREKRRGLFPSSFDGEFGDPPSFGKGGIRFDERGNAVASDDWLEGTEDLDSCRGDPNELATLCALRPFHAPTLMATANAVARLGMIELAWPLCCRSLRAYTVTRTQAPTPVAYDRNSQPLFEASYMAGRLASMRGATETAANLFKFCLSLDESRDPKGVLMRLSADLYAAQDFESCLALFDNKTEKKVFFRDVIPTVCLCRALAHSACQRRSLAVDALVDAFAKFPHLLVCLIDACEVTTETSSFKDVVWHDHFRKANWTVNQARAYARGGLPRALDVACLRTRSVFKNNVDLILAAAKRLVEQPATVYRERVEKVDRIWSSPDVLPGDYSKCPVTDFTDTYEQLGPDAAEGFDASLLSPQAALDYQQRRIQRRTGVHDGGILRRVGGEDDRHFLLQEIIEQLPEGDLRTQVLDQLNAGADPEDVQAFIFRQQLG